MVESSVTLVMSRIKMQNPSSFNLPPNWVHGVDQTVMLILPIRVCY
jgi:hypothetical protein